jgi:hypothetical protein
MIPGGTVLYVPSMSHDGQQAGEEMYSGVDRRDLSCGEMSGRQNFCLTG